MRFYCGIPGKLEKCMERFIEKHRCFLPWLRVKWTTENLLKIEQHDHKLNQVVDFLYKGVVEAYDFEFIV